MKLSRPSIGATLLSLIVAAWIVLGVNSVFWNNVAQGFGDHDAGQAAFSIGISALIACALVSVSVKYLIKPLFILLIVSSAAASWFMQHYGVIIDTDMIRNAAETTPAEAGHLLTPAFITHMLFYAVVPSLLVAIVRIKHRTIGAKVKHNLALIVPLLLLTAGLAAWQFPAIASTVRNNKMIIKTLNPLTPIASTVKYAVRAGQESVIVAEPLDADAKEGPTISHADKPVVTIIVAGETARAKNFSLGGYERKTNPELEKRDITYFANTTSCGTATAASLPCMFSLLGHADYSHSKGLAQENLMDVLAHAGINVTWWENQTGDKEVAKRINLRNFSLENDPRYCVNTECRDQFMVDQLGAWLDNVKSDSTLVLHQLGSHGPSYFARYSEQERVFTPDCQTDELADCTNAEIVNAYDNTIIATDHMLAQVIDLLAERSDNIASSMIYMSDHGESLGEMGLYLHGMPYMLAPEEQTHVPFIMWLSKSYSEIFDVTTECLRSNADKPYSHDNLFHTVLGLMNIEANHYDAAKDVTSSCRNLQSAKLSR
jgi:lipid A ethanolaminephosphotransferase